MKLWCFLTSWLFASVSCPQGRDSHPCVAFLCVVQTQHTVFYSESSPNASWDQILHLILDFCPLSSVGARPKLTKRNSMDSVELWKFSTVKVTPLLAFSAQTYGTLCDKMFFHCRTVRTKTLRAYPGEARVSFHSRAKGKAILTVSHRMRGRGWTHL